MEHRTFVRDHRPYDVPERLEDLAGPAGGVVDVPHEVLWAPGGPGRDLDDAAVRRMVYVAVVAEGTRADQATLLNRDLLVTDWPRLMIPRRARELWEARFPELAGGEAAATSAEPVAAHR
ncbi:transcriptional regulator [Nocardioides zeae]|uniref:Transcriptional regulator n=1 Tax=Nocardioides zeae TaxID=1457234 RepID=A0A6P0HNT7_9ACTN|nr:transcriptional regulator [Nocardioides zeae]NEN80301.1 transcriptional regulator [Nocardioides zeae]